MTDSNFRRGVNLAQIDVETSPTADASYTVLESDDYIILTTTGAGSLTLTFGVGRDGQRVMVRMAAQTTGTYTTVGIDSGEILFGAANEFAAFIYDATNDTWRIDGLQHGWQDITVDESELTGASDTIAGVAIVDAWITSAQTLINEVFAGDAAVDVAAGDVAADGGILLATGIDSVAAGEMTIPRGLEAGQFNATFTPLLTFTATNLANLTTGNITVRFHYTRGGPV
jgi:hypothetical protein